MSDRGPRGDRPGRVRAPARRLMGVAGLAATAVLGGWGGGGGGGGGGTGAPAPRARAMRTYTVSVPTADLTSLMAREVFTDSGRFYPCRANPSCAAWGHDIALSRPSVAVEGPRLVFSVHLDGSYAINQFFTPTVAGDLVVSGVPIVRGNKVGLAETRAAAGPASDVAFKAFLEATHSRIESMLEQSSGFDLAQYLALASSDPQLPPPRLPDVRCVDPAQIQVQSVSTVPGSAAVDAVVTVSPAAAGTRARC